MKILVIEDEPKTLDFLARGFTEAGFDVAKARDGRAGLEQCGRQDPDVVILDIMLPGLDGWSVLDRLRQANRQTPVLVLSACDAVDQRVKGLDLGADDYLIKPFAFAELLARVRSLRRRVKPQSTTVTVADLRVDLLDQRVWRGGALVDLSPQEFRLLSFLAQRCGQVVSRSLILQEVWNLDFDPRTNVVDVAIRRLRRKIDDPYEPRLIHTVRGVGYRLQREET